MIPVNISVRSQGVDQCLFGVDQCVGSVSLHIDQYFLWYFIVFFFVVVVFTLSLLVFYRSSQFTLLVKSRRVVHVITTFCKYKAQFSCYFGGLGAVFFAVALRAV